MQHHIERIPLNVYDSITIRDFNSPQVRLFGNANIGNLTITNLCSGGLLVPTDASAMLRNWYARSDMPTPEGRLAEAWTAWIHATTATLVVGAMMVYQSPLADLLQRKEGQNDWVGRDTIDPDKNTTPSLAKATYERYERDRIPARSWRRPNSTSRGWHMLHGDEQAEWVGVVEFLQAQFNAPLLAYVPRKQNCFVHLTTGMSTLGKLREAGGDVLDRRIWIHLDGIQVRDYDDLRSDLKGGGLRE